MRIVLLLCYLFFSCTNNTITNSETATLKIEKNTYPQISYDSMKHHINTLRRSITISTQKSNYAFLEEKFISVIVDSIFPYWYGTEWDFNGTTQTPGKGTIACGYFVSTVLRDAGLQLNRVKLGQSSSEYITKQFADKKDIRIFYNKPLDSSLAFVKKEGKGLFIVGLDSHVGFLYFDGGETWFIHSKWVNPKAVVKEKAEESGVLYYSKYKMIGKISNNKILLQHWVEN